MAHALIAGAHGVGLVEVLIALALVSGVAVMAMSAISTGTRSVGTYDRLATAQNIAQAQLEYTKSAAFEPLPASYDTISTPPANYSVTVEAFAVYSNGGVTPRDEMQKIVVTVYHQGSVVITKQGYKVDR